MDIWEIAIGLSQKDEKFKSQLDDDTTLLFVGSQKAGKTSLIYRFLNREENPRPTFALEYTFGRQSKANDTAKNVCNIWELGGGTMFTDILEIPINLKTLFALSIVVVVDLSSPEEVLITLDLLLEAIRNRIERCFIQKANDIREKLMKRFWKRFGAEHSDKNAINPMLVPLIIVGGKYDVFQKFEPEQRKIICRTLRMIAHLNGAGLMFFSAHIESLVNRSRAVLSNLGFDTPLSPSIVLDHNKPLFICCGSDSLMHIGGEKSLSLTKWKNDYETHFPQVSKAFVVPEDPSKDANFRESQIDDLRQQKDDEIEAFKKRLMMNS